MNNNETLEMNSFPSTIGENNIQIKTIEKNEELQQLIETSTLTAFFRSLVEYPHAQEIIDFLKRRGDFSNEDLQKTWDGFDNIFGEEYGRNISALSFSTIIEARGLLLDQLIIDKSDKNTIILELASGFSPRAYHLINDKGFNSNQYIETDRSITVGLKNEFYNEYTQASKPILTDFDVIDGSISDLKDIILNIKNLNPNIDKLLILNEGLLIYLSYEQQRLFFDKLKDLNLVLGQHDMVVEYISNDIPSHENFTDWMLDFGFSHDDHIEVMNKVDDQIISSLSNTQNDFFSLIDIQNNDVQLHYYPDSIINQLKTPKLEKYKSIDGINDKVRKFLEQEILFAYSIKY